MNNIPFKYNQADYFISCLLALVIIKTPVYNFFSYSNVQIAKFIYIAYVILFVACIYSLFWRRKSGDAKAFFISVFVSMFVLLNCYRPGLSFFVGDSLGALFLFMIIPFILVSFIRVKEVLLLVLNAMVLFYYIFGILVIFKFITTGYGYGNWAMMATYSIAVPTSYYIYKAFTSKYRIIYLLLSILGVVLSLIPGSRGCILLYFFAILLGTRKNIKLILFSLFIIIVAFNLFKEYLLIVFEDSRFLTQLQDGDLLSDSGRTSLTWLPAWNAALNSPIIGWGTYGDRIFTYGNQWTHNLFIEVFCDYGFILGGIFSFWFIKMSLKSFNYDKNNVYILLFLISTPQLLLSSSFLLSTQFWIYMGLLLNTKLEK